jgi:hypothetical protein
VSNQEQRPSYWLENIHVVFWLIKDASWAANIKWLGTLMIFPTLALAVYITYKRWSNITDRAHDLAISFWIFANSMWMVGEFNKWDEAPIFMRKWALLPFAIGLIIIAYYYLVQHRKVKDAAVESEA